MAPIHSRQLLAWTLPTIAALLSYLWYKRKRIGVRSDPPGDRTTEEGIIESHNRSRQACGTEKRLEKEEEQVISLNRKPSTPSKIFSRSLSGVETTPIDIVLPPKLRASRSASKVVSDQELDLEIEKMRNGSLFSNLKIETSPPAQQSQEVASKTLSLPRQTPLKFSSSSSPSPAESQKNKKPPKQNNKMVRKEIDIVSEQITSSLNISNNNNKSNTEKLRKVEDGNNRSSNNGNKSDLDLHRQSIERDSANHSPADVMLASPSLSIISDNHSEVSVFSLIE